MPPQAKITRQMILDATLEITRQSGFEAVNARSIAARLQCSTRPLFTCYRSMEALKEDFLSFAFDFYTRYTTEYGASAAVPPGLVWPMAYLRFARAETQLFRLLFISDLDLDMAAPEDFYRESGNAAKAQEFAAAIGVGPQQAKAIFLDLFLYAHGLAVLTAAGKVALCEADAQALLQNLLAALAAQANGRQAP